MSKAVFVSAPGGPEVLQYRDYDPGRPGQGEILVRNEAIGLNFIDVYHRTGLYPNATPFIPGLEAAGVVIETAADVSGIQPGDRIACYRPLGAYAQERIMPADNAFKLPDGVDFDTAAAVFLKGMTACYLLTMTYELKSGETALIHAAAGGVGQLLVQWAKSLGATVIATVGSDEKAERVRALGADLVINMRETDFVAQTREFTGGRGADVVYDSIGKDTFEQSLDCLRPRGLMVSFGNSSGPVAVPNLGVLASKGSLYLTRPTMNPYFADPEVDRASAEKVFSLVQSGVLSVEIGQEFPLADVAEAHRALEGRRTRGATVLRP